MKIRTRLVILFLVISIVPMTVFGIISIVSTEQEIRQDVLRELDALASIQENRVEGVLDQNLERLVTFTSRLQLKISIDNYNKNGDSESLELVNRILQSAQIETDRFRHIHVLNLDGIVMASTDNAVIGQSYAQKEFFLKGIEQNDVYDISKDNDGNLVFNLSGPMVLEGNVIGVAVIVSDASDLVSAVRDSHTFGETSETALLRMYGDGAQFIVPLKFDPNAALVKTVSTDSRVPAFKAFEGIEDTFTDEIDYRNMQVIAATRYIEGPGWALVVKVDKTEAYAPLDNIIKLSIIVGAIVAVAAVAASFLLGRAIAIPILKLRNAAAEITKGNYDIDIAVDSEDEVGQLANDFCNMKDSVKSTNENLERLVEQRTAELVEKDKALENTMEKLLDTEKAKDEFVSMVSHELKTPLVPIKGYSEMLLKPDILGSLNDKQKKAVQTIMKSTGKMETLIGDVLDAFKLDMDKMKFLMSDVDATDLINQTILDLQSIAEEKGVKLEREVADHVTVFCDPARIEQVLANLIKNSVDFVPAKEGRVIIKAEKEITTSNTTGEKKEMALFSIEDNGPGIPIDKLDNIFKKFYQIDTSVTRKHGGTGLGLVVCKGIVEAHGGKIWVDTAYQKGACLKFTLPLSYREGSR